MARYTGPKTRIARKFKEPIFGPDKWMERKPHAPGQHGLTAKRRKKESEYSTQLQEKQKAKYIYGILERQFEKMFVTAASKKGITGETLLQLCETRLDNTVFRLGIAPTRRAARQLVSHGHITVNKQVVNIPSYSLRPGDSVAVRERSRTLEAITNSVSVNSKRFDWLDFDATTFTGKLISVPERAQIPENIREQLIVELYSK
ncbi:MAG TPA: 30S ribosomal protein S4 [Flavobacteriales bacterium]